MKKLCQFSSIVFCIQFCEILLRQRRNYKLHIVQLLVPFSMNLLISNCSSHHTAVLFNLNGNSNIKISGYHLSCVVSSKKWRINKKKTQNIKYLIRSQVGFSSEMFVYHMEFVVSIFEQWHPTIWMSCFIFLKKAIDIISESCRRIFENTVWCIIIEAEGPSVDIRNDWIEKNRK